ncbi:MAG: hypothetical protein ACJATA_000121 [Sphingobacteriales bacterium]|jgi:hypothetical protein
MKSVVKFGLVVIILMVGMLAAQAQAPLSIQVFEDPSITKLMNDRHEYLKNKSTIEGYRVQLFFGSREGAIKAREKLTRFHPELKDYIIFDSPYFKLRVGDYRTRLEAFKVYKQVVKDFDSVFIVPDQINFPNLKSPSGK